MLQLVPNLSGGLKDGVSGELYAFAEQLKQWQLGTSPISFGKNAEFVVWVRTASGSRVSPSAATNYRTMQLGCANATIDGWIEISVDNNTTDAVWG